MAEPVCNISNYPVLSICLFILERNHEDIDYDEVPNPKVRAKFKQENYIVKKVLTSINLISGHIVQLLHFSLLSMKKLLML